LSYVIKERFLGNRKGKNLTNSTIFLAKFQTYSKKETIRFQNDSVINIKYLNNASVDYWFWFEEGGALNFPIIIRNCENPPNPPQKKEKETITPN
jgi:hypothetical protein